MDTRASTGGGGGCGRVLWLVGIKIVLILVWSTGASAHSDKALSHEAADSGEKDAYLSHSCIHDEILHQRRRAGRKEYSVMPQVYHVAQDKAERLRGRQLLGVSSWRAPRSNVKKPIRIYLNYDAVGHSPDRDCKSVGDIVKLGEPPVPSAPGTPLCAPHGDPPLVGDCWYNCTFEDIAGDDKKQRLRKGVNVPKTAPRKTSNATSTNILLRDATYGIPWRLDRNCNP